MNILEFKKYLKYFWNIDINNKFDLFDDNGEKIEGSEF